MLDEVLLPLDGSEPGELLLPFAEKPAISLHPDLCLVHVYEPNQAELCRVSQSCLTSVSSRVIEAPRA